MRRSSGDVLAEAAGPVGGGEEEGGLLGIELLVLEQLHVVAQHDALGIALVARGVLAAQFQGAGVLIGRHPGVEADGAEGRASMREPP